MAETVLELEALIEETPAMLWRGDCEGQCVFLNRAQREFWGVDDPSLAQFSWASTLLPEDQEKVFGPFRKAMTSQSAFTCEGRYCRADGAVRILRTKAAPYFAPDGTFHGMVGVNEDVTDLREAQANLDRQNRELATSLREVSAATSRLELATEISGLAMSEHDADLRYTWAHNVAESCIGKTPSELLGGEMGARVEEILRGVLLSGERATAEINFLLDGERQWWEIQACRIETDSDGHRIIASALNVTVRKLNETKLELLANELAHRVKNIYSVTQAVIQQSARTSEVPKDFLRSVSDRLATLARAQEALLATSGNRVSVRSVVEANIGHLSRIEVTGDDATVSGRAAPYLALALHELGTNALKYGALAHEVGAVELTWREDGHGHLHIEWKERSPVPPEPTDTQGFGTALLTRIFAAATNGRAQREFAPSGLQWTAVLPIAPELTVSDN